MDVTDDDLRVRLQGKVALFVFVGAVSAILLFVGIQCVRGDEPLGYLALVGSALFWWPLFRLGMYHARKRRHP